MCVSANDNKREIMNYAYLYYCFISVGIVFYFWWCSYNGFGHDKVQSVHWKYTVHSSLQSPVGCLYVAPGNLRH